MKPIPLIGFYLALFLCLALGFILWAWQEENNSEFDENIHRIQTLQQLNAHWSLAALQSYLNTLSDFDQVAQFLPKIEDTKQALLDSELHSDRLPHTLTTALSDYLDQLDAKGETIERFKSNYAIVRNSARYLPQIGREITREVTERKLSDLAGEFAQIQEDMEEFLNMPTRGFKLIVQTRLDRIKGNLDQYPEPVAQMLREYIAHAEVLLRYRIPLATLVKRISEDRSDQSGMDLLRLYSEYERQSLDARTRTFPQWVAALAILAAGLFLVFMILILLDRSAGVRR